jgi:hypothetical protein
MKKSRTVPIAILALALLCCVAVSGGYALYSARGRRAMEERPLVLIHTPVNRKRVPLGEGVPIHATARARGGVSQTELWVDGAFVSVQKASVEGGVSPLVLVSSWKPATLGEHVVVVRAISAGGVAGQASIVVEATEDEVAQAPANEASGDGEEAPGEESPEGEAPGEEPPEEEAFFDVVLLEGLPDGVGGPPAPIVPAPGADLLALEVIFAGEGQVVAHTESSDEPVGLRIEILALQAEGAYEKLHCYLSVGEREPLWHPDTDGNQDTEESFASLGGGAWDVAEHLAGGRAPLTSWPGDQPLPIDVACVGIAEGGTNAVELGRIEVSAEPVVWDGIVRRLESAGGEGAFVLEYRIGRMETSPGFPTKDPDPSMTSPENLALHRDGILRWDYNPRTDPPEEPIDGFRVYLNDTFQWVMPPDAREMLLPSQWLHPPCGDEYRFTVTAYRGAECPTNCSESLHSNERTIEGGEIGDPECGRQVIVDFYTLTTGDDLGGDGSTDPGDVGPIYGWLYANDQEIFFDGRCVRGGRGTRNCAEVGLVENAEYDVAWSFTVLAGLSSRLVVFVPDGEHLAVAFNITDADSGRNARDDLVCTGEYTLPALAAVESVLDTSSPSGAFRDRCRMTYSVQFADGSSVIESGDSLPLPLLQVEEVRVNASAGEMWVRVRNIGNADWRHDLTVGLTPRQPGGVSGNGDCLLPDVFIPVGGEEELLLPANCTPERPMDFCVTLDPENAVTELGEETGATRHTPYCPPLPDLVIDDVMYDSGRQKLLVLIRNVGDGELWNGDLDLLVRFPGGDEIQAQPAWWEGVTMRPGDPGLVEWPPPGAEPAIDRDRLQEGYTVALDPGNDIPESDDDNNTFGVAVGVWLRVMWDTIQAPRDHRDHIAYWFKVDVFSTSGTRHVADWAVEDIDWDDPFSLYDTDWFYVAGDETVMIKSGVWYPGVLEVDGRGWVHRESHLGEDGWGDPVDLTDCGDPCGHFGPDIEEWRFHEIQVGVNVQYWGVGFYYCMDRER